VFEYVEKSEPDKTSEIEGTAWKIALFNCPVALKFIIVYLSTYMPVEAK
jgi:hypothetical protein